MGEEGDYQALVLAALAGDRNAFNELVKRFRGMAVAVANRRLHDKGMTEDAVQEAFLIAFLKLSSLKDTRAFPIWFRKILHTCCTRIEKQQLKFRQASETALSILEDPTPGTDEQMIRFQSRAMVARTLTTLDSVAREACVQRYILGRPYKEISIALRVPEGTIKRRLHDARNKVIKAFENDDRPPSLNVGYLPISDHLLGMVSHCVNRGRLRLHMKRFLSWASLVTALKNGLLDAAFIMAPLALALRNTGVPIVYVMDAHHEGSAITVRNDMPAGRLKTSDRVGMPYAISTHSMLFADVIGFDHARAPSAIKTKYRGPSYLLNSLVNGDIDAFFCAEPWNTKAVIEGAGRILARSRDFLPGHICCILVVREELLKDRGELVRSYLKLLLSTNDYLSADHGRSARIQERYTGVSASIIEQVLSKGDVTYTDIIPDRERIETLMNLAIRAGILDRPCDLDNFLRNDIL